MLLIPTSPPDEVGMSKKKSKPKKLIKWIHFDLFIFRVRDSPRNRFYSNGLNTDRSEVPIHCRIGNVHPVFHDRVFQKLYVILSIPLKERPTNVAVIPSGRQLLGATELKWEKVIKSIFNLKNHLPYHPIPKQKSLLTNLLTGKSGRLVQKHLQHRTL